MYELQGIIDTLVGKPFCSDFGFEIETVGGTRNIAYTVLQNADSNQHYGVQATFQLRSRYWLNCCPKIDTDGLIAEAKL